MNLLHFARQMNIILGLIMDRVYKGDDCSKGCSNFLHYFGVQSMELIRCFVFHSKLIRVLHNTRVSNLFQNLWIIILPALRTAFNSVKYSRALIERDFEALALSTTWKFSHQHRKSKKYIPESKDVRYYAVSVSFIISFIDWFIILFSRIKIMFHRSICTNNTFSFFKF